MRRTLTSILVIGIFSGAVFGAIFLRRDYEGSPPEVKWADPPTAIGQKAQLHLQVSDPGSGIAQVTVKVEAPGATDGGKVVLDENVDLGSDGRGQKSYDKIVEFDAREVGLRDGAAKLTATARDRSRRNSGQGNISAAVPLDVQVRTRPPTVELLSEQHNIDFGGAMMVAYRVGSSTVEDGIRIGDRRFPGHPSPADSLVHVSLFALSFREPENVEPILYARDDIGNEAEVRFYHKVLPRKYPDVPITLKPEWIEKIRDRFALAPSLDDTAAFLEVNNKLRQQNHATLDQILRKTEPQPLWSGVFLRMPAKPVSAFAETRSYLWNGKAIDQQVHLGVDLAALMNFPVPASAAGVVIHAGDLGIYGNCVIIDHGQGLATLYGHMSSMAVAEGDRVEQGKVIGRTGTTGLAFGDHLHFGIYVGGVAVDPKEWWDPLWIQKRIAPKLAIWRNGGPVDGVAPKTADPADGAASSDPAADSKARTEARSAAPPKAKHGKHGH